jgi:hypothetical protein
LEILCIDTMLSSKTVRRTKKTPKETRYISKEDLLQDATENVRHTRDHIFFVIKSTVHDVLVDLLPSTASVSTNLFPRVNSAIHSHAATIFPKAEPRFLKEIPSHMEKHENTSVAKMIHAGISKPGHIDYACAMVLLRIAFRNYGRGAGCVTNCRLVGHFDDGERYRLISHYDKLHKESKELFDTCVNFYEKLVDILEIDDLRDFHNMVFMATGGYCEVLPFKKLLLERIGPLRPSVTRSRT